jgi:hypothetical protein
MSPSFSMNFSLSLRNFIYLLPSLFLVVLRISDIIYLHNKSLVLRIVC